MLQQIVVIIPFAESFGSLPIFIITEDPVPKVAFAIPGEKHPSPKAAACESPIIPVILIGRSNKPLKLVSPKYPEEGFTSGRCKCDNPKRDNISSFQLRVCKSKNKVLD